MRANDGRSETTSDARARRAQAARKARGLLAGTAGTRVADERFRRRLLDYLQWGSKIAEDVSQPGADTTTDQPVPVWDWGPEGPP